MMWIWYFLLGSGSGLRTVGKFFKSTQKLTLLSRRRHASVYGWVRGKRGGGTTTMLKCGRTVVEGLAYSYNVTVWMFFTSTNMILCRMLLEQLLRKEVFRLFISIG